MNALKQLLQDNAGNLSSMRVGLLIVVGGMVFNWIYLTIHTGQTQQLDWQQVAIVIGAFGAKAAQKAFEPNGTSTSTTTATTVTKP